MSQFTIIEPEQLKVLIEETIRPLFMEVKGILSANPSANHPNLSEPSSGKEDLITRKEACKLLHISHVTLAAWSKKGILPFYRMNRRVYFKKSEILSSMRCINAK
jgi:excisionase family DNA binding protein